MLPISKSNHHFGFTSSILVSNFSQFDTSHFHFQLILPIILTPQKLHSYFFLLLYNSNLLFNWFIVSQNSIILYANIYTMAPHSKILIVHNYSIKAVYFKEANVQVSQTMPTKTRINVCSHHIPWPASPLYLLHFIYYLGLGGGGSGNTETTQSQRSIRYKGWLSTASHLGGPNQLK